MLTQIKIIPNFDKGTQIFKSIIKNCDKMYSSKLSVILRETHAQLVAAHHGLTRPRQEILSTCLPSWR